MKRIFIFITSMFFIKTGYNQSGTIDSSFSIDGFISSVYLGGINSVTQQHDGKILAAGSFFDLNASVARYLPDGTLDSTFGINGGATSNPSGGANKMILFKNGEILICGRFADEYGKPKSFVARFTENGKPDSSFGIDGSCIIPTYRGYSEYSELALASDGSLFIGGAGINNLTTLDSQYTLISHVSADGVFDSSFGNNGFVLNLTAINMKDLAIQPDGKIVTAGYNFAGGFQQQDFVFSRYNTDGSLDNGFGNNGNIIIDGTGGEDVPGKIIIQQDGKIVFGGYSGGDAYYMSALRFNSDGSLDKSFGTDGKTFISFNKKISKAYDMVMQPDGKFILAGSINDTVSLTFGFCRINHDGTLDSGFGDNGTVISKYMGNEEAYCAALQSDGKILLGGYNYNGKKDYMTYLMARYNNDLTKKQIIIAKIRRWIQHHNGIMWDNISNVKNYSIQRSGDGAHWSIVYKTHGNPNTHSSINLSQLTIHNYYNDPSPLPGANYYRLQTTSIDGAVQYSNVLAITNNDAIKISPNPAKNILHIEGLSSKARITVISFSGFTAISQQLIANGSYNLNIASLQPGNYLLKIEMNGDVVTKKFLKE